jgi:hypothetical protein
MVQEIETAFRITKAMDEDGSIAENCQRLEIVMALAKPSSM